VTAWVIKGRPSRNAFEEMLVPGAKGRWVTKKPPSTWTSGDALFFWKGAPGLELVSVGTLVQVFAPDAEGRTFFEVEYSSGPLAYPLGIAELRANTVLDGASFLKAGAAGTVFPLTAEQAGRLADQVMGRNRGLLDASAVAILQAIGEGVQALPARGLLIREPHVSRILDGQKTWEIRGSRTNIRGSIALIRAGSGLVVGTCDLVDVVGPLSVEELLKNADQAALDPGQISELITYESPYAWVVRNARWLPEPVAYSHPSGAVIWVNLEGRLGRR
jgi:hypothetical protein